MRIDFEYWPNMVKPRAVMLKVHRRNHDTLTIHIVNPPRREWSATATDGQSNSIEYRSKNMVAIFRDRWN